MIKRGRNARGRVYKGPYADVNDDVKPTTEVWYLVTSPAFISDGFLRMIRMIIGREVDNDR